MRLAAVSWSLAAVVLTRASRHAPGRCAAMRLATVSWSLAAVVLTRASRHASLHCVLVSGCCGAYCISQYVTSSSSSMEPFTNYCLWS